MMRLNQKKIQVEACRIASGATKLVVFDNLYQETRSEPAKRTDEENAN